MTADPSSMVDGHGLQPQVRRPRGAAPGPGRLTRQAFPGALAVCPGPTELVKAVSVSIIGGLGEGAVPDVVVAVAVVNRSFHEGHCMIVVLKLEEIFPRLDDSILWIVWKAFIGVCVLHSLATRRNASQRVAVVGACECRTRRKSGTTSSRRQRFCLARNNQGSSLQGASALLTRFCA
jgi:hypothetical protein